MKNRVLVGASLGFALALSAQAGAAAQPSITIDPVALGGVDAVTKFCSNRNPSGAAIYTTLTVSTFGTQPAGTLLAMQSTAQYKLAFKEVHAVLASAPGNEAWQFCVRLAPPASVG